MDITPFEGRGRPAESVSTSKEVFDDDDRKLESLVRSRYCRLYDRRRCAAVCQRAAANDVHRCATGTQTSEYGLISLNFGVDWASAYYFRGIAQEQSGANFQPYGSLSFKLIENAGPLTALTATPGTWNNWHAGGGTLVDPVDPKFWYESDLYFTLAATLWENVTIGLTYTAYTSPNDSFRAVQELALGVSLNDSKWLGAFALNPSLLVAGEVDGQADAGRPTACTCNSASTPGTLWRRRALTPDDQPPGHAGAQRGHYYEFGTTKNPVFGYVQFGPVFSVPVAFIPKSYGTWTVKGAVEFLFLGETLKPLNDNDVFKPIGRIGIAAVY